MNGLRRIFRNEQGGLRTGWKLIVGLAAGYGTLFAVRFLLGFAFGKLFEAWGITNGNLAYAPVYAQHIVIWHTDFTHLTAYIAGILVGLKLAGRWTKPAENHPGMIAFGAFAGIACGALTTAASLALDSMRLEWPLGEPMFSTGLISGIVVLAAGCLCNEVIGKRLVFDPLRQRFGRWPAYLAVTVISAFAGTAPLGMLNSALIGFVGCLVYERGGLTASTAMQAAWMFWTNHLFAWPDSGYANVYRMFEVSEGWLTGGGAGAEAGIGCTILWMIIAACLLLKERNANA